MIALPVVCLITVLVADGWAMVACPAVTRAPVSCASAPAVVNAKADKTAAIRHRASAPPPPNPPIDPPNQSNT